MQDTTADLRPRGAAPFPEVRSRLELAREKLQTAQWAAGRGFWRDAASRAYFSAFHAATALLLTSGQTAKTHRGLLALVRERFIVTGILEERHYDTLRRAGVLRENSDHSVTVPVDEEDVQNVLVDAGAFLNAVEALLV